MTPALISPETMNPPWAWSVNRPDPSAGNAGAIRRTPSWLCRRDSFMAAASTDIDSMDMWRNGHIGKGNLSSSFSLTAAS
jgi:hypothetical protein